MNSLSGGWLQAFRRLLPPIRMAFLLCVMVVLLPPFLVRVGRPTRIRFMETICMETSLETWYRLESRESDTSKLPSIHVGLPRIENPPMLVWLNLTAWSGLRPDTASALWLDAVHKRYREIPAPVWLRRFWNATWAQLAIGAAPALPFVLLHDTVLTHKLIKEEIISGIGPIPAIAALFGMLAICRAGWQLARNRAYVPAAALLGLWMIIFTTLAYGGYSMAARQQYAYRPNAERLATASHGAPVYLLRCKGPRSRFLADGIRIFPRLLIPSITHDEIEKRAQSREPFSVIAPAGSDDVRRLLARGFHEIAAFRDDRERWQLLNWQLLKWPPPAAECLVAGSHGF